MQIAFQGETGAFSEEAVRHLFPGATPVPTPTFEAVFERLMGGAVERAVVPIENSLFGSVHANYDLLRSHPAQIVGEVQLRIRHHLMGLPGARLDTLRRVHSHPQALGQCAVFLRERLPHVEPLPAYDTAGAARMVAAAGHPEDAAIAARRAADEYGLVILAEGIESHRQNYTRFLVLAREADAAASAGPDDAPWKTSIVFSLRENVPGALFKSLAVFALRDLDLYKIESRPLVGSPGKYLFYLDVEGTAADTSMQRALDHLAELTADLRVLGVYRRGWTVD